MKKNSYVAPAVLAVLDAADAIKGFGFDKSIDTEMSDPGNQSASAAYRDEE